jgi:hypothetical protein
VPLPKHKQPSAWKLPKTEKQPVGAVADYWCMNPAWRFNLLELCDPFGWHVLDEPKLYDIRQKLSHFEIMTMSEYLSLTDQIIILLSFRTCVTKRKKGSGN